MFYHESDLHVGSYIKVYGRDMLIHDCDDYTRNYYMKKWNVSKEMLEPVFVQVSAAQQVNERVLTCDLLLV